MHILYSVQTRTHPGKVRANNQDDFGTILEWREKLGLTNAELQTRGHLFAVADGMGGHAAGEVASRLAIETLFRDYYTSPWRDPEANLTAAIGAANQRIFAQAATNPEMNGMGTTLVAALYLPERWLIANVGDSRAYLFRNGRIRQVTEDHSWVAEQARSGILSAEEAAHHPLRNVITRSLGNEERVQPDVYPLNARPEDILLLCSDGLSNLVSEKEMTGILKSYPLDEAAEKLLALALERGASDNVTLILVKLVGGKQRRSRSVLPWLALAATLMAIGGFVFWNYTNLFKPTIQPTPAGPLAPTIATFTPLSDDAAERADEHFASFLSALEHELSDLSGQDREQPTSTRRRGRKRDATDDEPPASSKKVPRKRGRRGGGSKRDAKTAGSKGATKATSKKAPASRPRGKRAPTDRSSQTRSRAARSPKKTTRRNG